MRSIFYFLAVLFCGVVAARAQNGAADTNGSGRNGANGTYVVTARDANSRQWAKVAARTNEAGQVTLVTNRAYLELASGLNKFSTASNAWVDADATIDVVGNNGSATRTAHSVTFAQDAAKATGAVNLTTTDGKTLVSRVYGLAYSDSATGSNVLLGLVQSSQGNVVGTSEVVYSNFISGPVTADLEYDNKVAGIEQNVVIGTVLPAPDSFGLNDATARLQIWTEFLSAPEPQRTEGVTQGVTEDLMLDFGAMKIGMGKAFSTPQARGPGQLPGAGESHVWKHWVHEPGGRVFLIEEIPFEAISNAVQNLPPQAARESKNVEWRTEGETREMKNAEWGMENGLTYSPLLPLRAIPVATNAAAGPMRVALRQAQGGPGLVIDYSLMGGYETNYVFQGDTTYYVSSTVYLYGNNVAEGGTVVKFANTGPSGFAGLWLNGYANFVFAGSAYRPSVFTDENDDGVGDTISGSSGTPSMNNVYYLIWGSTTSAPVNVSHARFSYAGIALSPDSITGSFMVQDCQFLNTYLGVYFSGAGQAYLENVLCSHLTNAVFGYGFSVVGENVTADDISAGFCGTYASTYSGNITNSIFTAVAGGTNSLSFDHSVVLGSRSGVYQTVGAGSYYLRNGSPALGLATANIDAATLADLQGLTTFPPVLIGTNFTGDTVLWPQAPRDTGLTNSGYHYAPLDFVWSNLTVEAGVTLTLTNGVAVGTLGATGLTVNGHLVSQGTPGFLNYFGSCAEVQEAPGTELATLFGGNAPWQGVSMRFAELPMLGGFGDYLNVEDHEYYPFNNPSNQVTAGPLTLRDCQLEGGNMEVLVGYFYDGSYDESSLSINFINDVLDRCGINFADSPYGDEAFFNLTCRNDLFHGGSLNGVFVVDGDDASWLFFDNLFDNTALSVADSADSIYTWGSYLRSGNNGYINAGPITNSAGLYGGGSGADGVNDQYPPAADYQIGALGNFYYPTTGGNLSTLIHMGDAPAASYGLYEYTVTTNNVIEGSNTVSIGFHYVATDGYGNPLSTLVPGIPDYLVDANGNGVYGSGDLLDWMNPFAIYDQGVSYDGYYPLNVRLGYWKFDTGAFANQAGYGPSVSNYASVVPDWSSHALALTSLSSDLEYPVVTNGWTNLNYVSGTVRFWYEPDASFLTNVTSGNNYGSLVEVGVPGTDNWALTFVVLPNNGGTNFEMAFRSTSNGYTETPIFFVPVSFRPNSWCQIALTYSPTNIALYTNGVLVATGTGPPLDSSNNPVWTVGNGMSFYPSWNTSLTFGFGNNVHSGATALGEFDELETFNYPLTAEAIAAGFPTFAGDTTNNMQDTDYDGRSDLLETLVDGTDPTNPAAVVPCRLGYWRFDSPFLFSEEGQLPVSQSGVTLSNSWSGTAVNIGGASSSELTYPEVGTNGWANFNCSNGSVMLWFKPNWSSGGGPSYAPLVFLGTNATPSAWCLGVDASGSDIVFDTEAGSGHSNRVLSCSFPFTNNQWCQIALTYGPGGSYLFTNGMLAASNLSAISYCPNAADRALGMVIGNNTSHNESIKGQIDELETFNYNLAASDIATNFQTVAAVDRDLDGVPDVLEDIHLARTTPYLGAPVVVTGTVKAEEFDMGGSNVAYYAAGTYPTNVYRRTGMWITNCDDLGRGYCLATGAGDWANYSINVLATGTYVVEARVAGMGTGGTFQISITNSLGAGPTSPTMTILTNGWTNMSCQMTLTNLGTNILTLSCVTAGTDSPYVGRFNYISVYPYCPTPTVGSGSVSVSPSVLSNNMADFLSASNNAFQIQTAINSVSSTGGTVTIPSGVYYLAQESPSETNFVWDNAAVSILGNNIEITGQGETDTTLIAFGRATCVFSVGRDAIHPPSDVTNFTLSDMTIKGQPHNVSTNADPVQGFTNITELGEFNPPDIVTLAGTNYQTNSAQTGTLVFFYGGGSGILITNCEFIETYLAITGGLNNCVIQDCTFVQWDSNCTFTGSVNGLGSNTANTVGIADGNVSIFVGGTNIVLLDNSYNGNATITNVGNANTNLTDRCCPDGWVWLQSGGNFFVARNALTNNFIEMVSLGGGPTTIVQNTFYSLLKNTGGGECAVNFAGSLFGGFDGGKGPPDYTTGFINNWVYGEGTGALSVGSGLAPYASSVHVSGNYFNQPFAPFAENGDGYGAAVGLEFCDTASICGNTMVAGGYGVGFTYDCTNALILNNDFSGATYMGIGYEAPGSSLPQARVFGNKLGQGLTFHGRINYGESFGWFFKGNQYLNGTNVVTPFLDPVASEAHVSN